MFTRVVIDTMEMEEPPAPKRQRLRAPTSYLAQFATARPGPAGGGLFDEGRVELLTRVQAAALRLAWAGSAHPRLGADCPASGLIEDLVFSVGSLPQSSSVVVRSVVELRAVVASEAGAAVIELDPAGSFERGKAALLIGRAVRLVSAAGGRATLAGGEGAGIT